MASSRADNRGLTPGIDAATLRFLSRRGAIGFMNNFLVFMPGGGHKVEAAFPRHYRLAENSLWAVASSESTCADVCEQLGIGPGEPGVVSRMDEYYGHYDRALWEKLSAWSAPR